MRTVYHEFESLEHLLSTRLLPGGDDRPISFVVFGGTGAVGGAAVMELCRLILQARHLGRRGLRGEVYATGLGDKEISKFVGRLYMALGEEVEIEKLEPLRHYRLAGRIDLRFSVLRLQIPSTLEKDVEAELAKDPSASLERLLAEYFAERPCPFLGFVEGLGYELLHAVMVAIPLPSVATYTLGNMDALVKAKGLDHATGQRIKKSYLQTFIRGLAVIQQRYARHVVMAHTTAVGGMYRVDGGRAEIRLGFAHSALGKKMVDKKYFADELTQLFVDHGFDVLVTAAAIGIDAVDFRCHLPSDRAVVGRMRERGREAEHEPWESEDLETGRILLYPSRDVALFPVVAEDSAALETASISAEARPGPEAVGAEAASEGAASGETASGEATSEEATSEEAGDEGAGPDGQSRIENPSGAGRVGAGESPLAAGAEPREGGSEPYAPRNPHLLKFGRGKDLIMDAAIRSGENGLFSVANCVALYHVMKVAIPEELAMVLVRHAVFGPERRRDWFRDKICYYSETDNSY
ncbi:MAG: hypothetical protein MI919_05550, partial [Holophagales bacterium]|nr:hypothetical protein [Holophagales bacterium]